MKRLGLEPIRLDPSHSWTQNDVMVVPSTDRITQTLKEERKKCHGYQKEVYENKTCLMKQAHKDKI